MDQGAIPELLLSTLYLARFREQTQPISSISLGSIYLIDLKIPMFASGITAGPAPIGQEANQLPRVRKAKSLVSAAPDKPPLSLPVM